MAGAPLRGLPSVAEAARALNAGLLRVATALDAAPHSAHFQRPVSTVAVPDYRSFVRAEDEVCLARVQARARDCDYPSVAAFRADITGIFHNAVAYNSPGCGAHAYEPVIHWARALVVAVEAELQRHREPLAQAEAQLQSALYAEQHQQMGSATAQQQLQQQHSGSLAGAQENAAADNHQGGLPGSALALRECGGAQQQQQDLSPDSGSHCSGLEALLAACELAAEQAGLRSGCKSEVPAPAAEQLVQFQHHLPAMQQYLPPPQHQQQQLYPPLPSHQQPHVAQQQQQSSQYHLPMQQQQQQQQPAHQPYPVLQVPHHPHQHVHQQHHHMHAGEYDYAPSANMHSSSASLDGGLHYGVPHLPQQPPQQQHLHAHQQQQHLEACSPGASARMGMGMPPCSTSAAAIGSAFRHRRHKSKVYIKPNKVVYLPTTFVEEEFDVAHLPLECELLVEADGLETPDTYEVTIKAVPRQGLSTMYCMTNVMRFQQRYLNWQITNWTRMDNAHIKVHVSAPNGLQPRASDPNLDRCTNMPGEVPRYRRSEEGHLQLHLRAQAQRDTPLKRKSDTGGAGRYNLQQLLQQHPSSGHTMSAPGGGGGGGGGGPGMGLALGERKAASADGRRLDLGGGQYRPSPIPESPPRSPRGGGGDSSQLPPRPLQPGSARMAGARIQPYQSLPSADQLHQHQMLRLGVMLPPSASAPLPLAQGGQMGPTTLALQLAYQHQQHHHHHHHHHAQQLQAPHSHRAQQQQQGYGGHLHGHGAQVVGAMELGVMELGAAQLGHGAQVSVRPRLQHQPSQQQQAQQQQVQVVAQGQGLRSASASPPMAIGFEDSSASEAADRSNNANTLSPAKRYKSMSMSAMGGGGGSGSHDGGGGGAKGGMSISAMGMGVPLAGAESSSMSALSFGVRVYPSGPSASYLGAGHHHQGHQGAYHNPGPGFFNHATFSKELLTQLM